MSWIYVAIGRETKIQQTARFYEVVGSNKYNYSQLIACILIETKFLGKVSFDVQLILGELSEPYLTIGSLEQLKIHVTDRFATLSLQTIPK